MKNKMKFCDIFKKMLAITTAFLLFVLLTACNDKSDISENIDNTEPTEIKYTLDVEYDFRDITLYISDKWKCEETYNSCTIKCPEDYSFMLISLFDISGISDYDDIYNSCISSEGYQDVSKLRKYEDYPLYTFNYTEKETGYPVECLYFIKNDIIYFISVPKSLNGKESVIYDNLNDIILPIKTMLLIEGYVQ